MRGLVGSGVCLALGVLVASAHAEDGRWQLVGQAPAAATPTGVSLRRPIPLEATPAPADPGVTPAGFAGGARTMVFRAKPHDQPPQPLPPGPPNPAGAKPSVPEQAPAPNPAASPAPAPTPSSQVWGDVVSRWVEGGAAFGGVPVGVMPEGAVVLGGDGSCLGDGCCLGGDVCCPPCDPCCGDPCGLFGPCCGVGSCCPFGRVYGSAEYLMWTVKDGSSPPLVTAGPPGSGGSLAAGSTVLYGGDDAFNYNIFSGGRFNLGFCIPRHNLGIETTFFFLSPRSTHFVAGTAGTPELGRPFVEVTTGNEVAQLAAQPNVVAGAVAVDSTSRLWGIEGNLRHRLCCGCNSYLDLLGGFRFLELNEDLRISENLTLLAPLAGGPAGTRILVFDNFSTRNEFYGGQLGLEGECRRNRWSLGGSFKLGMGVMHQVVNINGATVFLVPGLGPNVQPGGLLALPSNSGRFSSDRFAVIPEVGVKVGYQLTNHVRLTVGYTFRYVSDGARPGD
ncbi:MAG: BBP7 family outer membrane beta-barrel protein, partial [Gemmataceae bacterium]|nr:BBP7 family outer membrane beta-barrel protein [Gemmataceae bacterium]